jgi:sulfonate transport system substrate-binding protein
VKSANIAPASVLQVARKREANGVRTLDAEAIDDQLQIADAFHRLGRLPKHVATRAAVWNRTP